MLFFLLVLNAYIDGKVYALGICYIQLTLGSQLSVSETFFRSMSRVSFINCIIILPIAILL